MAGALLELGRYEWRAFLLWPKSYEHGKGYNTGAGAEAVDLGSAAGITVSPVTS